MNLIFCYESSPEFKGFMDMLPEMVTVYVVSPQVRTNNFLSFFSQHTYLLLGYNIF